jgi:hypothetical protein
LNADKISGTVVVEGVLGQDGTIRDLQLNRDSTGNPAIARAVSDSCGRRRASEREDP